MPLTFRVPLPRTVMRLIEPAMVLRAIIVEVSIAMPPVRVGLHCVVDLAMKHPDRFVLVPCPLCGTPEWLSVDVTALILLYHNYVARILTAEREREIGVSGLAWCGKFCVEWTRDTYLNFLQ
jgi:hypothetical protein